LRVKLTSQKMCALVAWDLSSKPINHCETLTRIGENAPL
jgi:hypothetical protein